MVEQNQAAADPTFDTSQGSTFNMLYGERSMKGFPVTEDELDTISTYNTQTQTFIGVGSFFASLLVGSIWDPIMAVTLTPAGELLAVIGPWIFSGAALVFYFLAWRSNRARANMVERIKNQTRHGA